MVKNLISTSELVGMRVLGGKSGTRRIGKVRRLVFHPKEKRVVGFIVKRPDLLWMFRRKDKFVAIDGYDLVDGRIVVRNEPEAPDKSPFKRMGINWDDCVLWMGLPVMTESGEALGAVGNVMFNRLTGAIDTVVTDSGATANALLGRREIPASMVKGFRRGMGTALARTGEEGTEGDEVVLGAILVTDDALEIPAEGGIAEKAGETTAVVLDKAHTAVDKAKPVVSEAAKKTGEAVNKGVYATGKQIAKSKTMFSDFKEEYDKARGPKPSKSTALAAGEEAAPSSPVKPPAKAPAKKAAANDKKAATGAKNSSKSVAQTTTAKGSPAQTSSVKSSGSKASAAKPAAKATAKTSATNASTAKTTAKTPTAKKKATPQDGGGIGDLVARQVKRTGGMFSAFKEEYDKARHDD